jgi:hypothetical protein
VSTYFHDGVLFSGEQTSENRVVTWLLSESLRIFQWHNARNIAPCEAEEETEFPLNTKGTRYEKESQSVRSTCPISSVSSGLHVPDHRLLHGRYYLGLG